MDRGIRSKPQRWEQAPSRDCALVHCVTLASGLLMNVHASRKAVDEFGLSLCVRIFFLLNHFFKFGFRKATADRAKNGVNLRA